MLSEDILDESEPPEDHMSLDDDDDAIDGDSNPDEEFVELDPTGRYGRYAEILGRGATKTVYKAYDMVDCKEVAWNKAKPNMHAESPVEEALAMEREIILLQSLNCKGIMKLYNAWVDETAGVSNFITELCSSTLLAFRLKHKYVSRKAVKSWARQILEGLVYLHMQDPPIIHRDLKCENIFVKSCSSTTLKIGDFGCATILDETQHMHTMVGTPEFMAPEMFQEDYNELVDVYSFGMCMLELLTRECPYTECASLAQVYKRVISGEKPKSLLKVKDVQALQFINRCLLPASKRPSAKELLDDPFLQHKGVTASSVKDSNSIQSLSCFVPGNLLFSDGIASKAAPSCGSKEERVCGSQETNVKVNSADSAPKDAWSDFVCKDAPCTAKESSRRRIYQVLGTKEDENTLRLKICIQESSRCSNIVFPFDLKTDTPAIVAEEMVRTLNYPQSDLGTIADLISEELAVLAVNLEEDLAAPTCSQNSEGSMVCAASPSNTAFMDSDQPFEETGIGNGKGCYEMPALLTDEESKSSDDHSSTTLDAYWSISMANEAFQGSAPPTSGILRADKLSEDSAALSSDEKIDCSLSKQRSAAHLKSSIAAHKRRLHLILSKNSLNFKQVPWKPPSEQGIRRRRPVYVTTRA